SFIGAMGDDERKIKIVQSILVLGKALGIDVVAEGVETPEQADVLRRLGCERAQGYFFARPLPLEQLSLHYQRHWGRCGAPPPPLPIAGVTTGVDSARWPRRDPSGVVLDGDRRLEVSRLLEGEVRTAADHLGFRCVKD